MADHHKAEYVRFLKSQSWADVKKYCRMRANYRCERCEKSREKFPSLQFEVAHTTYEYGWLPPRDKWDEVLLFVCEHCHHYMDGRSMVDPANPCPSFEQIKEQLKRMKY